MIVRSNWLLIIKLTVVHTVLSSASYFILACMSRDFTRVSHVMVCITVSTGQLISDNGLSVCRYVAVEVEGEPGIMRLITTEQLNRKRTQTFNQKFNTFDLQSC